MCSGRTCVSILSSHGNEARGSGGRPRPPFGGLRAGSHDSRGAAGATSSSGPHVGDLVPCTTVTSVGGGICITIGDAELAKSRDYGLALGTGASCFAGAGGSSGERAGAECGRSAGGDCLSPRRKNAALRGARLLSSGARDLPARGLSIRLCELGRSLRRGCRISASVAAAVRRLGGVARACGDRHSTVAARLLQLSACRAGNR
jgi:hypothetical protein